MDGFDGDILSSVDLHLAHPEAALAWLQEAHRGVDLDELRSCDVFVLVGLAALARDGAVDVTSSANSAVGRFAHALGFDAVVDNAAEFHAQERERSVCLSRFTKHEKYERAANDISKLLFPLVEDEEARQTLKYVLVELFRNVNQHSQDPRGGVVAAQRQRDGSVQVAIADSGIGIPQALSGMHPLLEGNAEGSLNRAICAHISGSFEEGQTGGGQNAGMGLFFISEMTKLVGGTLLLASRGASLLLRSNPDDVDDNELQTLLPGYDGTLVVFSLLPENVGDFEGILENVNERARRYTPQSGGRHSWLSYDAPPEDAMQLLISVASEDTQAAIDFAEHTLVPHIMKRRPLALNFQNLSVCTQSFLHALLYEPVRLAWARKVPIHIVSAKPAVKSGLRLLENYALAA